MKNYTEIVNKLLELDKTKNISSIEIQSDYENSVEMNVVYYHYDDISEELWDYTLSFCTEDFRIDNFGIDQETPEAKAILYKRGEE